MTHRIQTTDEPRRYLSPGRRWVVWAIDAEEFPSRAAAVKALPANSSVAVEVVEVST